MKYIRTTLATGWTERDLKNWKVRLIRIILFFVPDANPDHEKLYPDVKEWLLEIDENGRPNREVGLNSEGLAILAAPDDRNFGLWTDSPNIIDPSEYQNISEGEFETKWKEASSG